MRKRLSITGIWVDPVDLCGAARIIAEIVAQKRGKHGGAGVEVGMGERNRAAAEPRDVEYVCTPNAEIMMEAWRDAELARILNGASLVVADGAGVVLAARILGYGKIHRTAGYDLANMLLSDSAAYPFSFYFLGGKPGIAEAAAAKIRAGNPAARIVGCHDGYFSQDMEPGIVDAINASGADILFVALGAPRQEKWIYRHRDSLNVAVCMGVGGTIDNIADPARLAPPFFREHGLEWLYRLCKEPWRAKRMLRLPQYVLLTLWLRLRGYGKVITYK